MINNEYPIREAAKLFTYITEPNDGCPRDAVVVLPGGGFIDLSPSEGECVALTYLEKGLQAFVLNYSTLKSNPDGCAYPTPIEQLAETVLTIRQHAKEWHVNPARIFVLGFSAGAYVCAQFGNHRSELAKALGCDEEELAVAGAVLCYPPASLAHFEATLKAMQEQVSLESITGSDRVLELQSFARMMHLGLAGKEVLNNKDMARLDPLAAVNASTPPTFIWGTVNDDIIDPAGIYLYAQRLAELGIPHEVHVFEQGAHGLSLGNRLSHHTPEAPELPLAAWVDLSVRWMRSPR